MTETALTVKQKKKISDMTEAVAGLLAKYGIDSKAIMEKRDEEMLPSIPKEFRDEAKTILVKSRGAFALSNIGQAHQDNIPEFDSFLCDTCDEVLGMENSYWIALGNMEYLRVVCPNCKSKVIPLTLPPEKAERLNEREPSIKKAMELAGLKDTERIVDIKEE